MGRSIQIDTFSRFTQVSRETIDSLVKYENILIKSNEKLNLIGKSTINNIETEFLSCFYLSQLDLLILKKKVRKISYKISFNTFGY